MVPFSVVSHHYCIQLLLTISTIFFVQGTLDLVTPELYILDANGNERRSDDIAVVLRSGVSLICRTSSTGSSSQPFYWQFSTFDEQKYESVTPTAQMSINTNGRGEVTLQLTKVTSSMAGTYRCTNGIISRQLNVHIYGVEDAVDDTVRITQKQEMIGSLHFHVNAIDTSYRPTVACSFRVGRNGIKYTSVRWKGGLFDSQPSLYDVSYAANEEDGHIWSNLTIKSPVANQGLYGRYRCLFNVVSGQMQSADVFIRIPPLIEMEHTSVDQLLDTDFNYTCSVVAYPSVTAPVTWSRNHVNLLHAEDGRVYASDGNNWKGRLKLSTVRVPNDQLSFNPLQSEDRAIYACYVENQLGNATGAFFLRVKNRWAILWPLIGIFVEFLILFVIIVVYELRQRAKRKREQDVITPGYSTLVSNKAGVVYTAGGGLSADHIAGAAGDHVSYHDAALRQRSTRI